MVFLVGRCFRPPRAALVPNGSQPSHPARRTGQSPRRVTGKKRVADERGRCRPLSGPAASRAPAQRAQAPGKAPLPTPPSSPQSHMLGRKGMRLKSVCGLLRRSGGGERKKKAGGAAFSVSSQQKHNHLAAGDSSSHHRILPLPHAKDSALCFRRTRQPLTTSFNWPGRLQHRSGSTACWRGLLAAGCCCCDRIADRIACCAVSSKLHITYIVLRLCVISSVWGRAVSGPARRREDAHISPSWCGAVDTF
jgi:hypothetical protein